MPAAPAPVGETERAPLAGDGRHAGLVLAGRGVVQQQVTAVGSPVSAEGEPAGGVVQVDGVVHH